MEKLSFDVNVALKGYAVEAEAQRKATERDGRITSRSGAMALKQRALANLRDIEEERKKRRG